jgi:hypothetical protein
MKMTKRTCPACGRLLETKLGKFDVEVWPQHKMAKIYQPAEVTSADFAPGHDRDRLATHELSCPNSCKPVDL